MTETKTKIEDGCTLRPCPTCMSMHAKHVLTKNRGLCYTCSSYKYFSDLVRTYMLSQKYAFLMGTHTRLGQNSPVQLLCVDVLQLILKYVSW